ncbi:MAG: response regulator transcription factor [Cyanobacteriota bacterium]|nr:response regulator transcription factor [Cyanobacteriota bacterium]
MAQVWILDDDAELCQMLEEILQGCGWTPRSFHEPRSFEAALGEASPDLLVLDKMLPRKPGTQVLAGLRQAGHRFPVLMLSALGAPTDRVQGLEMGADDYLAKPFLPRELELRIEILLRQAEGPWPQRQHQGDFRIADLHFQPTRQQLSAADGRSERLSRGDVALLLAFCQAPGLVLNRDHLAQACGTLVDPDQSRSLDVRISKLRRLFSELSALPSGPSGPIETVRGRGYRLTAAVQPQ